MAPHVDAMPCGVVLRPHAAPGLDAVAAGTDGALNIRDSGDSMAVALLQVGVRHAYFAQKSKCTERLSAAGAVHVRRPNTAPLAGTVHGCTGGASTKVATAAAGHHVPSDAGCLACSAHNGSTCKAVTSVLCSS